jgi:hypothetical protein
VSPSAQTIVRHFKVDETARRENPLWLSPPSVEQKVGGGEEAQDLIYQSSK